MKKLLEFYLAYFDFLYSDPGYRITDSRTGDAANAGLTVTGPVLEWVLTIDAFPLQHAWYLATSREAASREETAVFRDWLFAELAN